jgi:acetolactate synthase regulatory subunit
MDQIRYIELDVLNTPTILIRIIQMIKQKRLNIKCIVAEENLSNSEKAKIKIVVAGDSEKTRLLKSQFWGIIDVISIK